ncbi:Patatin-like protein 2 [Vitis vinifera]|uniref:Patatin n=1 Tax=Vitis vinifera TaxID=29760 RepID=A0A438IXU7_VITVI|nr:Patatin-like protein 2 [Vitis vinifera]
MASTQGSSPRTNGKVITILSIDGGGVRGIIPAVILYSLEAELQRIDGPNARIADYFDVIAGTSTGSIVTALLTTPYTPPNPPANASKTNPPPNASITNRPREAKEIPEFYKKHGPAIFQKRKAPHNSNSGSSLMAVIGFFKDQLKDKLESFLNIRYDNSTLQLTVDEEVGTIRLADTLTDVLIPAYDIEHRKLVTFSSHQERNKVPKSSLPLRQAVLGSAAAPTYFPRHHFQADGKIYNLVDGGMAANNPTLLAIREAINIFGSRDDNSPFDWILDLKRGIPPLASLLFETSADMVDTYTSIFLGGGQNSRHQFLRIQDYTLNPKQLKMDKATEDNFNNLINIAKQLLDKPVSFPSSWIGLEPTTTNRNALGRFANDLSKIRGDAAKKLSRR